MAIEFAQLHGYAARTARAHRARKSDEWLAFLRGKRKASVIAVTSPDVLRSRELTEAAYSQWRELSDKHSNQIAMSGDRNIAILERAVGMAQKRYHEAVLKYEDLQKARGLMIPAERVRALRRELEPLAELILQLESNIAGRLPEHMRLEFAACFKSVVPAWNEGIKAKDAFIEELLGC